METIEDIVEAMRGRGEDYRVDRELWKKYADRIEAAIKREREATTEKSLAVGNAAKMREALKHIEKLTQEFNVGNFYRSDYTKMVLDIVSAALSAPHAEAKGEVK